MSNPKKCRREVILVPASGQRMTTPQVAYKYQVTPRTVQEWRDLGKIPFIRVNARTIRYDEVAVDRALANAT
jgi:predicted site-specific integrase-resolvase